MTKASTCVRVTKYLFYFLLLVTSDLWSQSASQPFTVVISAPATATKSGSIVRLDITVNNNLSDRMFLTSNRLEPGEAGISIRDSDGNQLAPRDEFKPRPDAIHSRFGVNIPPGKSITESVDLNRWFDLTKPGQYTVQAKKRIPGSHSFVESNKLTITITP